MPSKAAQARYAGALCCHLHFIWRMVRMVLQVLKHGGALGLGLACMGAGKCWRVGLPLLLFYN
jgi:hypothetical protein